MDETYRYLARRIQAQWAEKKERGQSRLIIALAGPPGCGKTTIANKVVQIIAADPLGRSCTAISADGFHLPRSQLRSLPNAEEAFARRGAPWTFDGAAVVTLVHQLKQGAGTHTVWAPTFDHALKDPVPNGHSVGPEVEVCILEGNYLLSDQPPWNDIAEIVDDRWFVDVEPDIAKARVAARHLKAGIESTMEAALERVKGNDMINGDWVRRHSVGRFDVAVESVQEKTEA